MLLTLSKAEATRLFKLAAGFTDRSPDDCQFLAIRVEGGAAVLLARSMRGCATIAVPTVKATGKDAIAVVHAGMLAGIVARAPGGDDDDIVLSLGKSSVVVTANGGQYRVPILKDVTAWIGAAQNRADLAETGVSMPAAEFEQCLSFCVHAAARNDVRYYLNGVMFFVEQSVLRACGCDGHRLATRAGKLHDGQSAKEPMSVIVPTEVATHLRAALDDGDVTFSTDGNVYHVQARGFAYTGQAIDGRYPDIDRVIPEGGVAGEVPLQGLLEAVDRAAVLQGDSERTRWVRLAGGPAGLTVGFSGQAAGSEDKLLASFPKDAECTVDVDYLRDACAALDGATLEPAMVYLPEDPNTALRLVAGPHTAVIMPVRV